MGAPQSRQQLGQLLGPATRRRPGQRHRAVCCGAPAPGSMGGGLQADLASVAAPGLVSCPRLSLKFYPLFS